MASGAPADSPRRDTAPPAPAPGLGSDGPAPASGTDLRGDTAPSRRYAVFLRGVNVGGITLRMADLRELLAGLPLRDVATVLASGNATCTSDLDPQALRTAVQDALRRRFAYEAWVVVVEHGDLVNLAASVPVGAADPGGDRTAPAAPPDQHTYVTFFTEPAERDALLAEARDLADRPVLLEGAPAVAWRSPKGSSTDMPLAKILARSRYAAVSTTRNINTVHRVLRLLDA
ncbi:DUF1697 domain-containing protein [Arthrobacter bussei]|nr:DUF1697 domain-containing protein [Arthrobacter bussei]